MKFLTGVALLSLSLAQSVPHTRTYHYIGGSYIPSPANSSEHLHVGQVYIEHLSPYPLPPKPLPAILLLHGNAQTGTNWLNTPDQRPGWASHFLSSGYEVFIPDQPLRGRSPIPPGGYNLSGYPAEYIMRQFTYLSGWPQARLHTQWPGAGVLGDPIFDAFYRSEAAFEGNNTLQQERVRDILVPWLRGLGREVVLVAHSQAGLMAYPLAESGVVSALVLLEPSGPPGEDVKFTGWPYSRTKTRRWGLADLELSYEPGGELTLERVGEDTPEKSSCLLQQGVVRKLVTLAKVPMLLVTSEASYHAVYDHCTVAFLRQAGVPVEWMPLAGYGVKGNGHMFFMERNGEVIYRLVEEWISKLKG